MRLSAGSCSNDHGRGEFRFAELMTDSDPWWPMSGILCIDMIVRSLRNVLLFKKTFMIIVRTKKYMHKKKGERVS